jgi:serine/threonine protein kinase
MRKEGTFLKAQTILWDPTASYAAETALAIQFYIQKALYTGTWNWTTFCWIKRKRLWTVGSGTVRQTGSQVSVEPDYMAPEVVLQQYDHAIDWWELGVMIIQMVAGSRHFIGGQ